MAAATNTSGLLRCPKNLKECIDWVLRATERDNQKGTNNDIEKLKNALEAELKGSVQDVDLTQLTALASGLGFLAGLPACLCKTKESVEEGLKNIYKELKTSLISCDNLQLNCDLCVSKDFPCKCCVIQSIKAVKKCDCIKPGGKKCHCDGQDVSCAQVLAGLEACLHLQCLQSDMDEICKCNDPEKCCKTGKCTQASGVSGGSCDFCKNLNKSPGTPVPTTGLGLSPPNPIRLAERLDKFFGDSSKTSKSGCSCQCGSGKSCCCLACETCSSPKSCFCSSSGSSTGCSCASKLKLPKTSQDCPRKKFCIKIDGLRIAADSGDMTCCNKGKSCHCKLDSGSKCSGSNCCVVEDTSGSNSYHSLKCLIRRLVKFFKDLETSSKNCSKLCCEIFCVLKISYFLKDLFNDSKKWAGKKSCGKCKGKGGTGGNCKNSKAPSGSCCGGNISGCKDPQCCQGCPDCNAIKFSRALKALRFAGPCGQELYRTLDDFLNFCCNVFWPQEDFIRNTVLAAVKDCSKCHKSENSSDWSDCQCSSDPSSCQACPKLLKDSKLMSILRHGYVSSYTYKFESVIDPPAKGTYASWNSLCPSGSKCCSNPSCSQCSPSGCSSSGSCPSKCCPDCPQRKAAKIFLGMLPCLYYGLKILYDRAQDPLTWPDWHDFQFGAYGLPSSDLGRFLYAWGYDVRPLKTKKGSEFFPLLDSLSTLKVLESLSTLVTENYFTSNLISPPKDPKTPSTVRSMLLWLYGLPFTSGFHDLVSHCSSLCSPFGNSFNSDAFCYYIYTCCFLLPVAIISLIEDSSSAQKAFSSAEWKTFSYPSDPSDLFEKLCEYARKIFVALAFLYYQCERNAGQGGWNDCAFGRQCAQKVLQSSSGSPATSASSSTSSSDCSSCKYSGAYLCTAINKDKVHDHCLKGSCLGSSGSAVSCSSHNSGGSSNGNCKPCPHPLMRFLIDGSESSDSQSKPQSQSPSSPFKLPSSFARLDFSQSPPVILPSSDNFLTMGFKTEHLPEKARKGQDLYHAIYGFCKDGFYPLTRLVQFILCISQRPPESLFDLYAFFKKFAGALNSKSDPLKDHFVQWINDEPGSYSGSDLKDAVQNLYGSSHSNGSHSPANLFSLNDCEGPKGSSGSSVTCGKYLHALTEDVSGVFTPELCSMYLSWICYLAKDFKTLLERFHAAAEKKFSSSCSHCKSCKKIVECPCALPFIYSHGFTLNSPSGLNCVDNEGKSRHNGGGHNEGDPKCTRKTCSDFLTQLGLVVNGDLFTKLLKEIESFLWSIRLPFFLFILAFWAFVISYFLYVQLYKLDLLHLKSHAHFSRSFKIPPSILFSDASKISGISLTSHYDILTL